MSFKTTVTLLVIVVLVAAVIVFLQEKAPPPRPTLPSQPFQAGSTKTDEQHIIEEDFGDVVAITVRLPDQDVWRFERRQEDEGHTSDTHWMMIAPAERRLQKWQVEQIGRQLKSLTATVKHEPGAGGAVTAAGAGLDPPRAVVELTDDADHKVEVHIGRQEGDQETYVRLAGNQTIYRAKPSLKSLLKKRPLEYCEQRLFELSTENIVRLGITEPAAEGGTTYEMVKTGADWRFEQPAPAKGVADEIRKLCSSFAALRVISWADDNVDDPALFGLGAEALTVVVTTEETVPPQIDDAATNGEKEPPAPLTRQYTVRFADIGPLGEDNKVYLRRGDERLIGTVMKSVADTFQPKIKEWRDNRLTERNPRQARRIELVTEGTRTAMVRAGRNWSFEETGDPADRTEVEVLLKAIESAKAVNFVGGASADPTRFGLDTPRASLKLEFDEPGTLTIDVGGFADPQTQRLVFVRVGGADTVAKLRVVEANALVRRPIEFRDRTVLDVPRDRFQEISIQRGATPGEEPESPSEFTLTKSDNEWQLTAPVQAPANPAAVNKLVSLLSTLRAQKLIDLSDPAQLADYSLVEPQVRLSYTFLPPTVFQVTPADPDGESDEPTVKPHQPPAETYELALSRKDAKVYVTRSESQSVVYVLGAGVMNDLLTEYGRTDVFSFEQSQVTAVMLTRSESTQGFRNTDSGWQYVPEGDIPIDAKKVTDYLLRLQSLKAVRFVDYAAPDLSAYGLDTPEMTLSAEVEGTALPALQVSSSATDKGERYARLTEDGGAAVFLLPADALQRISIDIADFEQAP